MTKMCLRKKNHSTSEHADNAHSTIEKEKDEQEQEAVLCHFKIRNSALLYSLLLFFLYKSWSSCHSFSCVISHKMLRQNITLTKVLLHVYIFI
jgi:hypothetical protein